MVRVSSNLACVLHHHFETWYLCLFYYDLDYLFTWKLARIPSLTELRWPSTISLNIRFHLAFACPVWPRPQDNLTCVLGCTSAHFLSVVSLQNSRSFIQCFIQLFHQSCYLPFFHSPQRSKALFACGALLLPSREQDDVWNNSLARSQRSHTPILTYRDPVLQRISRDKHPSQQLSSPWENSAFECGFHSILEHFLPFNTYLPTNVVDNCFADQPSLQQG